MLKGKNLRFWLKAVGSTLLAWLSLSHQRIYFHGIFDPATLEYLVVMARQTVVWMITLIPATPGGAGVAEISFSALMCDITSPALVPIMALLWRMISFTLIC